MREIKFRGKRVNNSQWVYGYYVVDPQGKHRIYWKPFDEASSNTYHFVDPSTVGQFTGLKDKDGKEIWEGDKVSHLQSHDICIVVFEKETAMFLAQEESCHEMGFGLEEVTAVIGNIHEGS